MTFKALAEHVAESCNISVVQARDVVKDVFRHVEKSLADGEEVSLAGFGKFRVRQRGARVGRNPVTGDALHIPPTKIVNFTPAKAMKENVNS